jgi:polar amino acid transport system permease protein
MELLLENFANLDSLLRIYPLLLQGLVYTFWLSVVALPLGMLSGLAIAVLYSFRHRWLNVALLVYIDLFRSFPVVVLLILIFFGLPFLGLTLGGFTAAVLAIVLNNSGYYGEIFRAGILSVPQGQSDAARALGFEPLQLIFHVVLPQAVRNVMAPLASNSLELVKTTPIAALVALPELLASGAITLRMACGSTMWKIRSSGSKPSARAASLWLCGTERIPARKISP